MEVWKRGGKKRGCDLAMQGPGHLQREKKRTSSHGLSVYTWRVFLFESAGERNVVGE